MTRPIERKRVIRLGSAALALLASALVLPGTGLRSATAARTRPPFTIGLTTGPFQLPPNAASVDWMVVNDAPQTQSVRVTVFRYGVNQLKVVVPPGPVTVNVGPGHATHNANSVGLGKPFVPGFTYEVVVQANSASVHPSVEMWSNQSAAAIPGTLIPHGDFVPL